MIYSAIITFSRRLFHIRRSARSFESPRYLLKWLLISTLIGLVAGLGAIAFYAAIQFSTHIFLGGLVGYLPPSPAGEGAALAMPFWSATIKRLKNSQAIASVGHPSSILKSIPKVRV